MTDIVAFELPFEIAARGELGAVRQTTSYYFPDCAEVTMAYTLEASDGEGGFVTVQIGTMVNTYCPSVGLVHHTDDYTEYENGNPVNEESEEGILYEWSVAP